MEKQENKPRKKRYNKRLMRLKRNADNPLTAFTGAELVQLTGASDCFVTAQTMYQGVPLKKIAYALAQNWQPYLITKSSKKMKNLRVKQTCGVDQCVNPGHLEGKSATIDPWA